MATTFAAYFVGGLGIWLLTIFVAHFLSPQSSIPGPFVARFTKLWFLLRVWRGRFEKDNITLHQRYGNVIRYGPHHYSFNDPEAIKVIYGKGTEFDKSRWYETWNGPNFTTLFSEPSVKAHAQLRRKFQATYSMSSLVTYEGFVDQCIELFKRRLEEVAKGRQITDLAQWMLYYAGDTIMLITYSKRLGFLDAGEDVGGFFETLRRHFYYNTVMGIYAGLHPLVLRITSWLSWVGLSKGLPQVSVGRFTFNSVSEKRKDREAKEKTVNATDQVDESAPKDFLSKFLDSHEQDPTKFTERDIHVGLSGNVIAGSETTAAALTATIYSLLKNPSALSKLREEISSRVNAGELSSPPTFKEAHEMSYLQAVVQEAQRLYPQAGLPLQRVVPAGGAEICGYHFPPGTVVGVNTWVMHMNTSIFGEDAASFRPERWLESDKETLAYMQRHWMPFGLGSRTCIGKNISMLEMTKLIPELLRRFDFELGDELKDSEQWEWINYWLARPSQLPVRIRIREGVGI